MEQLYEKYAALSPEEQKQPYAKYYNRPFPVLPKEQQDILDYGSKMKESDVILADNITDVLHPERITCENGYIRLKDGAGYIAAYHELPEVSFEMYQWWNEWRLQGDSTSRYKIWCPHKHLSCFFTYSSEEIGGKIEEIYFAVPVRDHPEEFGLSPDEMKKYGLLQADGGTALSKPRDAGEVDVPMSTIVVHFIYPHPNGRGIVMRSRFWKGYTLMGGRIIKMLAPGQSVREEELRGMFEHNCLEMEYLSSFLPDLYREEKLRIS